jgi:hypothetical protein
MTIPDPTLVDWVPLWSAGPVAGYVPAARVYHNANQSCPSGSYYMVLFNSERFDTDNIHDTTTLTTRLTCRTAGVYQISGQITWAAAANALGTTISIYLNGTTVIADTVNYSIDQRSMNISTPYYLNPGDYVELRVLQQTAGPINILTSPNYSPEFSMSLLGPNIALGAVIPPTYGTSLPANPADGQEAILVDSLTNPTYQWRFRYNAGSTSAYKWEFIGGAPKLVHMVSDQGLAANIWVRVQPVFPCRAGIYNTTFRCPNLQLSAANTITIAPGLWGPNADPVTGSPISVASLGAAGYLGIDAVTAEVTSPTGSDQLCGYIHGGAGSGHVSHVRQLEVVPVKIA